MTSSNQFGKIQQGDKKAFESLFRDRYSAMCNFANSYLNDYSQSEDIVQAVFIKLWEKRSEIHIESSVDGFLFQSIKNSCLNELKHDKVKSKHRAHVLYTDSAATETDYIEAKELNEIIQERIQALPEKRREIFKLSRENGLRYAEIAEKLNISIKTVETQMSLSLKYLRENLKHLFSLLVLFLEGFK
ncbi:RNA polymerase sigma-70 factor [Acidiluteibacter ferrifornacis]|uniref:RNA polymerase sigma-70 factor n=1 Tax=Acidiluteibacter ferrifornacis TaxID=2692424 RepID=A0A6N9NRV1_9FLAO|nr:RNA polymerase sigma-70 factor [Acidiluteibacter ferrifornacis]NBG67145.1 RNA polymerase sigma-70 factor [Acidiluteibacter ferrifornacis]